MVKKKVSKKSAKKKPVKKVVRARPKQAKKVARKKTKSVGAKLSLDKKLAFSFRRFIFFAIITLLSFILYSVSGNEVYIEAFQLAMIIFGAIAVAFLIVVLVLFFMKKSKQKK